MSWINYLIIEVFSSIWVLGWIVASYINRMDAVIAKRGFLNTMIFSIVLLVCWSENILLVAYVDKWFSVPCPVHLFVNYMFFGVFMFVCSLRGICLLYEKNSGLIKVLNEEELDVFIRGMNFFEKVITRMRVLNFKLKIKDKNLARDQVIEAHFNQTRFFKPRFLLYSSFIFITIGAIIASIELEINSEIVKSQNCTFGMYLPLYGAIGAMLGISLFVGYLLRSSYDPYFMKYEFTFFMCLIMPCCYIIGLSSKAGGFRYWNAFITIMLGFSHVISVVIPNLVCIKNRKLRFLLYRSQSLSSLKGSKTDLSKSAKVDISELKKRAAQRFCVELVLFKEDYNNMKLLKDKDQIELACTKIYETYIMANSPLEINITYDLIVKVRKAHHDKSYEIFDKVIREVDYILYANLGINQ
eukprot:NODE_22_length_38364_cov_0.248661.p9 type:complete len:413 gc:universal NODE_22_length_38364_cov_0.248661:2277-3515(+)